MKNRVVFLGTGTSQGIPMIGCKCDVCLSEEPEDKRLRSSVFIHYNGVDMVIDGGPDFREQLLREKIEHLDAILLTHGHKDHTGGLDDVRAFNYLEKKAFPLYLEKDVLKSIEKEYYYAFDPNKYPGAPHFEIHLIDEEPFYISDNKITPIRVFHGGIPILGFRVGDMAYITDASYIPESEFEKLKELSILVINTVRTVSHPSHFSLPEAISVAQRIGAKKTYLTHLSHQLDRHKKLSETLPEGIAPAYDGLTLFFN